MKKAVITKLSLMPDILQFWRIALIVLSLIAFQPVVAKKPVSGDTIKANVDTIPVVPPAKNDLFSSSMFDDKFFDLNFDFSSTFKNSFTGISGDISTDVKVDVQDKKVIVTAQIPGADKNNININVQKSSISISAEMKIEKTVKDDNGNIISSSTQMRKFSNSQPLPVEVKPKIAKTDYKDGVLVLELERI